MLGYVFRYNGVVLNDPAMFSMSDGYYSSLTNVEGLSGGDSLVHTSISPQDKHGIIDYPSYMGGRVITIAGGVVGVDEDHCLEACGNIASAFSIPLYPVDRLDGYSKLEFWHYKNPNDIYYVYAKPHKIAEFTKTMHIHRMRRFVIVLRTESPFIYRNSDIEVPAENGNWISPIQKSLGENIGPKYKIYNPNIGGYGIPTIRITGPFENLAIVQGNQKMIFNKLLVNEGGYIDIDCEKQLVYANGDESKILNDRLVSGGGRLLFRGNIDVDFVFGGIKHLYFTQAPEISMKYKFISLSLV